MAITVYNKITNQLGYFLAGAGAGAIIALLFAPKSGRELRRDIQTTTKQGIESANQSVHLLGEKADELCNIGCLKAKELYETGKQTLLDRQERITGALAAGKEAYLEKKAEAKKMAALA